MQVLPLGSIKSYSYYLVRIMEQHIDSLINVKQNYSIIQAAFKSSKRDEALTIAQTRPTLNPNRGLKILFDC